MISGPRFSCGKRLDDYAHVLAMIRLERMAEPEEAFVKLMWAVSIGEWVCTWTKDRSGHGYEGTGDNPIMAIHNCYALGDPDAATEDSF